MSILNLFGLFGKKVDYESLLGHFDNFYTSPLLFHGTTSEFIDQQVEKHGTYKVESERGICVAQDWPQDAMIYSFMYSKKYGGTPALIAIKARSVSDYYLSAHPLNMSIYFSQIPVESFRKITGFKEQDRTDLAQDYDYSFLDDAITDFFKINVSYRKMLHETSKLLMDKPQHAGFIL